MIDEHLPTLSLASYSVTAQVLLLYELREMKSPSNAMIIMLQLTSLLPQILRYH